MPAYSKEREYEFIVRIRAVLVQNHAATYSDIKRALAEDPEDPIDLDRNYIGKLVKKIRVERAYRLDLQTLSQVLSQYQDESSAAKDLLWSFINDRGVEVGDKISAIRQMHDISTTVLDKLFDAGVFERSLGKLKAEGVLTPEQQAEIDQALSYVFKYRENRTDEIDAPTSSTPAPGEDTTGSEERPDTSESPSG